MHSLTRRIVLTICCALGLVWFGLLVFEFGRTRLIEQQNPTLEQFATGLHAALTGVDDPQLAASLIQAIDRMAQRQRREAQAEVAIILQVRDREGRMVFRSPADLQLDRLQTGFSQRIVAGTPYHVYFEQDERWQIAIGQARLPTPWLLKQLSREMATDFLIACPLLLIPVWLAVSLGMRPLRDLANRISKRGPGDLSPVQVAQRYAELNLLADAFNLQLARVGQLIARERAFLQDAAHELRTPMAVVAVNAHAAANAWTDEERAAAETRLQSGLSRTSHLVEQLLALTRLDVSRPNELALRDVVRLVRDDLASAALAAVANNIDLALEAPESLNRPVETHALQSIVGNLVDNAIRYGRSGGRVVVTVAAVGEGWTLSVADDGRGIAVADRGRVFERFYRGNHAELQGTGLGLAIVRAAATRLGGTVHITDGLDGKGCTFTVQFSMAPDGSSHPVLPEP